jgi:hypothetical protein
VAAENEPRNRFGEAVLTIAVRHEIGRTPHILAAIAYGQRPWCAGIVLDFAATGGGNLGTSEADRKSVGICGLDSADER